MTRKPLLLLMTALALGACAHNSKSKQDEAAAKAAAARRPNLNLKDDGTGIVVGPVTARQGNCAMGVCTLTVRSDVREVQVIYGTGTAVCPAGEAGQAIMVGQTIKAFGRYAREGEDGIIDVCAGHGGYINKL